MMRRLAIGVLCGMALSGCAPSANVEQVKAALMDQDRAWAQAAKDLDKFLSFYTADASVYIPEQPVVTGTAAIRDAFTKVASLPGFSLTWTAKKADASASGDLGYTAGAYQLTANDPATGKPMVEHGKYLTVWKKQADGQWKAAEDILNSDAPPPPPVPAPAPPAANKKK